MRYSQEAMVLLLTSLEPVCGCVHVCFGGGGAQKETERGRERSGEMERDSSYLSHRQATSLWAPDKQPVEKSESLFPFKVPNTKSTEVRIHDLILYWKANTKLDCDPEVSYLSSIVH